MGNTLHDYLFTLAMCRKELPGHAHPVHYERLTEIENILKKYCGTTYISDRPLLPMLNRQNNAKKYVTVHKHRGLEICTLSPANSGELGYIVDHPHFVDAEYSLVQDATDAIDLYLKERGQGLECV